MSHQGFMAEALRLAKQGAMTAHPNPMVGCVIVRDGEVIARGYHQRAGGAHAEVAAITEAKKLGVDLNGTTAYVTLEPCAHHGRTGPCCEKLVEVGIKTVVMAMQDPNPQVAGKGAEHLRSQGVEVIEGVMEAQALELNRGFIQSMQAGRPFVQLKIASSLDGRTAMASGESQWITGVAAREDVQLLRAQAGAIITGAGTFKFDDPALTVRPDTWQWNEYPKEADGVSDVRQPLRVVVSSKQPQAADLNTQIFNDGVDSIWATNDVSGCLHETPEHVDVWAVTEKEGEQSGVNLLALLQRLSSEKEVRSVLVEAGAGLAGAFIQAGLVDEVIMYLAPTLMGSDAREMFTLPFSKMEQRLPLSIKSVRQVGETVRISAEIASR